MMISAPEERSDEESRSAIRVQIEVAPPIASEALGLRVMAPIPTEDRASNPLGALRCGLRYTFRFEKFEKCDNGPGIARPEPNPRFKERTDLNRYLAVWIVRGARRVPQRAAWLVLLLIQYYLASRIYKYSIRFWQAIDEFT